MDRQGIEKCARRLHSQLPWLRRSACRKLANDASASAVPHLNDALHSGDPKVSLTASSALGRLRDLSAIDTLCELAIADPVGAAATIVQERDYQPQSISRRCVLFLLTGQFERYLDLDFEFQHLRAEYRAGDEDLRQRIGNVVRQSGDSRLIELFRTSRQYKLARDLTEREADIVINVHVYNQQWAEIFALLFHIPLSSVVTALCLLGESDWRPQDRDEAALLDDLFTLQALIGKIPDSSLASDFTLGPVLDGWIERGQSLEMRAKQPDMLRQSLEEGTPRDAVAALAALAASNEITSDDLEIARTHQHWLVRLSYLLLRCDFDLLFLFSNAEIDSEGGELWIDRLTPALLDTAVYRLRAIRINPDELEVLQAALRDKHKEGRWVFGHLLETLSRHHLRHTIEVDEQMIVEIGETDIEIEIEG